MKLITNTMRKNLEIENDARDLLIQLKKEIKIKKLVNKKFIILARELFNLSYNKIGKLINKPSSYCYYVNKKQIKNGI